MNRVKPSVEGVVLTCDPEEAWEMQEYRLAHDPDFSARPDYAYAATINERLSRIERMLIPGNNGDDDYYFGSARKDNDILELSGKSGVLVTAEHETKQERPAYEDRAKFKKDADAGTGALCLAVAADTNSHALIARGLQTGDPNWDWEHPFKDKMAEVIALPYSRAHLALHGMARAHAAKFDDKRGFQVMLATGEEPSDATNTLVNDYLIPLAGDLGLRIGVNQPHLLFDSEAKQPKFEDEYRKIVAREIFLAPPYTTRGFAQEQARKLGKDATFAAVEIELSSVIRPRRILVKQFPSERDAEIGAYLGYNFVCLAAESVKKL